MIKQAYKNSSLATKERVDNLLGLMTLEEKVAQMGSRWIYELLNDKMLDKEKTHLFLSQGIGQITRLAGASNLNPVECAETAN